MPDQGLRLPPPVPADLDIREMPHMPLQVLRLRDSDLGRLSSGEEFKAAVLLWCTAWHQVPASSLPKNDRLLSSYSGAGVRWPKVRAEALRGFVEADDGRLYHPLIAELALKAADARTARRERTARATDARRNRHGDRDVDRNVDRNVHQEKGREEKGRIRPSRGQGFPDGEGSTTPHLRQAHPPPKADPTAWDPDAPFGRDAAAGGAR